jgi:peptidoglycan/xylan/chitin deacetylase (PgdA/CDA1 family)
MLRALVILVLALVVIPGFRLLRPASQPGQIALTFDDLPIHGDLLPGESRLEIIDSILATLEREHMPPTYGFLNGSAIQHDPALLATLQEWRAAGQPLASHTWSHPSLSASTPEQFEADISRNEPLLESLMRNEDWRYLRYPYLDEGDTPAKHNAITAWLQLHHYQVAQVTQDFGDYLWNPPYIRCAAQHNEPAVAALEATYLAAAERQFTQAQTVSRLRYGREIPFVVLLHAGAFDAHMLPSLIALYRRHGLTFVTLQQAQSDPAYRSEPARTLQRGVSFLKRLASLRHRLQRTAQPRPADLATTCLGAP